MMLTKMNCKLFITSVYYMNSSMYLKWLFVILYMEFCMQGLSSNEYEGHFWAIWAQMGAGPNPSNFN
jgi:hypothetical protein